MTTCVAGICRAVARFRPVRVSVLLVALAAGVGFFVQTAGPAAAAWWQQTGGPEQLEPGQRVEREISAAEDLHIFSIQAGAEQVLEAAIDTNGMPLAVVLRSQEGDIVAQATCRRYVSCNLSQDQGRLLWISDRNQTFRLEVRVDGKTALPNRYRLHLDLRQASPPDYEIVAGEKALADGPKLDNNGRWPEAVDRFQEGRRHLRNAGELQREAEVTDVMASRYAAYQEPELAVTQMLAALEIWRELGDSEREALELTDLASTCITLGRWQEALHSARQALSIEAEDQDVQVINFTSIGRIYLELGEPEAALDSLGRAVPLLNGRLPRFIAGTLSALADAYAMLGDTDKVFEYRQRIVDLWHDMKIRGNMEALALNSLAEAYASSGLYDRALERLSRALELYRTGKSVVGQGRTLNNIGELHLKFGHTGKAKEAFDRAMDIWADWGDWGRGTTLAGLGEALLRSGDRQGALDHYREAVGLWRRLHDWREEARGLRRMAEIQADLGGGQDARRNFESALEIIESVRGRIAGPTLRSSYAASKRGFYESYIDLLMRKHASDRAGGFDALALEVCERARVRSLVETLMEGRVDIRRGASPELLSRERLLVQQINARQQSLMALTPDNDKAPPAGKIEKELEGLLLTYHETEAQIRAANPEYATLVHPRPLKSQTTSGTAGSRHPAARILAGRESRVCLGGDPRFPGNPRPP